MKKKLIISLLALASLGTGAQNLQKGDYGCLYCHMSGRGETRQLPLSRHHGGCEASAARLVHAAHQRRIQAPAGMVGQHHAQKSRPSQRRKEVKRGKWNIFVKTFGKHPFIWAENIIFALRIMTWQKSLMYYCSTHSKKNKRTFGVPAEWTNAGSYFFFLLCHLFPEYLRFPIFSNTRNCFSASPGVFSYIRE